MDLIVLAHSFGVAPATSLSQLIQCVSLGRLEPPRGQDNALLARWRVSSSLQERRK